MKRKRESSLEKEDVKKRKIDNENESTPSNTENEDVENEEEHENEEIPIIPIEHAIPSNPENASIVENQQPQNTDNRPLPDNTEIQLVNLFSGLNEGESDSDDDEEEENNGRINGGVPITRAQLISNLLRAFFDDNIPENIRPQDDGMGIPDNYEQEITNALQQRYNDLPQDQRTDEKFSQMLQRQEIIRSLFRPSLFGRPMTDMESVRNNVVTENHDLFDMQFRDINENDYQQLCDLDENNKKKVLKSEEDFEKICVDYSAHKRPKKKKRGRKRKVKNVKGGGSAEVNKTCTICMDEFNKEDSVKMLNVCSHIFHEKCLRNWLVKYKRSCPLCKEEIHVPVRPVKKKRKRRKRVLDPNYKPRRSMRIKNMEEKKKK